MLSGLELVSTHVKTAPLFSTLLSQMVISLGSSWIMETWVSCRRARLYAVDHTSVTWHLWRENVVFQSVVIARSSASGCQQKTTSSFFSFLTYLVSAVFQTRVSLSIVVLVVKHLTLLFCCPFYKTFRQDNRTQVFKCLTTSKVTEVTKGHTVYKK